MGQAPERPAVKPANDDKATEGYDLSNHPDAVKPDNRQRLEEMIQEMDERSWPPGPWDLMGYIREIAVMLRDDEQAP
jgi:hypothetical protein